MMHKIGLQHCGISEGRVVGLTLHGLKQIGMISSIKSREWSAAQSPANA